MPAAPSSCGDPAPPPPAAAAAAADSPRAAAADIDAGWEQVLPADAGEFDAWQPHQQQQHQGAAQQQWWPYQRKGQGQQQAGTGGEQPELGPEAWAALSHIRQVRVA